MNVSQALDDIKASLEGDPLVQTAVNLNVPEGTRSVLASVLATLEAEVARVTQDAAAQAVAGLEPTQGEQAPQ